MKKYFMMALLAIAAMTITVSCDSDYFPSDPYQEVSVSSSYVSISILGGSATINLNTNTDWSFETQRWIQGKDTTYAAAPTWLTVSQISGQAGQTTLTFSADKTLDGRSAALKLVSAGKTQYINVIQGLATISNATCAEILAGVDGKTYMATGVCTEIANTTYGNWYLDDGTGKVYIYGTLDAGGKEKNFLSLGIEVGDEVTVVGPKTTYGTTVELVNVTVVNINKSLIKVDSLTVAELPLEGGTTTAFVTNKGNGISVVIPDEAKSWLAISDINTYGVSAEITFQAAPNNGGDRSTVVTVKTSADGRDYTSEVAIAQKGAILEVSIADFNAAPVGDTQYRISGIVTNIANASRGRFYVADYSGETYVYNLADFEASGVKVGDIVTLVGKRDQYNETIEMTSATIENAIPVTAVSIADFLTKEDSKEVYYMVTGTLTEVANPTYGNLYLNDGTETVYVYGCYPGWGATGDFRKNCLETKGIEVGDQLTVIGVKSTYNGTAQVSNGIYFSHTKAGAGE